jgi:hypothetical protein
MGTRLVGVVSEFRRHDVVLGVVRVARIAAVVARAEIVIGQSSWDHQHQNQQHENHEQSDASHRSFPFLIRPPLSHGVSMSYITEHDPGWFAVFVEPFIAE